MIRAKWEKEGTGMINGKKGQLMIFVIVGIAIAAGIVIYFLVAFV